MLVKRSSFVRRVLTPELFDASTSHVIPALLLRLHEAKREDLAEVVLWGDGTPTREFLYVDDCAEAVVLAAERYDSSEPLNLASGDEVRISELACRIADHVGYRGRIVWDKTQPNGQRRRRVDGSRAASLVGFRPSVSLDEGIARTYEWMRRHVVSTSESADRHARRRNELSGGRVAG